MALSELALPLVLCPIACDFLLSLRVLSCAQFAYVGELVADTVCRPGYWLSFYFFLDALAAAGLLLTITPIQLAIVGNSRDDFWNSTYRALLRAGQLISVTRLLRVLKIVRILRDRSAPIARTITQANRIHLDLFGMQNMTIFPFWQP
jgi:hypothetical protein